MRTIYINTSLENMEDLNKEELEAQIRFDTALILEFTGEKDMPTNNPNLWAYQAIRLAKAVSILNNRDDR